VQSLFSTPQAPGAVAVVEDLDELSPDEYGNHSEDEEHVDYRNMTTPALSPANTQPRLPQDTVQHPEFPQEETPEEG
jgi:hypothetical protein